MQKAVVADNNRLFWALAEQLKIPLMQIAQEASLGQIGTVADSANIVLELLESYQLGSTASGQDSLDLRPTMVSVALEEAAHKLTSHARNYNCEIVVEVTGHNQPAMADSRYLRSAFVALGYGLIEAQSGAKKPRLVLSTHRTHRGLAAGAFGRQDGLSSTSFNKFKQLSGRAQQPWPQGLAYSGAGIFIADTLLQAMAMPLRLSHHGQLNGLASTLIPSRQLELVSL